MSLTVAELQAVLTLDTSKVDTAAKGAKKVMSDLSKISTTVTVGADTGKAEAGVKTARQALAGINGEIATMTVDADTSKAESALKDAADTAAEAGADGGKKMGSNLMGSLEDGLSGLASKSGPIVGGVLGAIAAVAAISPGMQIAKGILSDAARVRQGELMARMGMDAATATKVARAAGEAYARNFGESVDSNADALSEAISKGLISDGASSREMIDFTSRLQTVTGILGEDVPMVARAAGQAVRTGLAKDGVEALDLLTKAQQSGINVADDLLDTISEYGTQFRVLGLDGPAAMGLMNQAVKAGARDMDTAADTLKEFAIRSIDGSDSTADGFKIIGLNAADMSAKIAKGGDSASKALNVTLDELRKVKDPVKQNAAAVALFGTKAEDLGAALYAMDLDTAAKKFGKVKGSVDGAMAALSNNAAAKVETAKRAIETAATGVGDALAAAFSPQLGELADWVSSHRTEITDFLLTLGGAAIDGAKWMANLGVTTLRMVADTVPAIGGMTDSVLAFVQGMVESMAAIPGADKIIPGLKTAKENIASLRDNVHEAFDKTASGADAAADAIEGKVIPAIDGMKDKYDDVKKSAHDQAAIADAANDTAKALGKVGESADGSQIKLDGYNGSLEGMGKAGEATQKSIKDVMGALADELTTAKNAGEGQKDLRARYFATRDALLEQLQAMGLTKDEAKALFDEFKGAPKEVLVKVQAELDQAKQSQSILQQFYNRNPITATVKAGVPNYVEKRAANGMILDFFANGSENHVAQIARPGEWRVWAEPETGGEAYIPLAPSKRKRSREILRDVADRFGMQTFADGGISTKRLERLEPQVKSKLEMTRLSKSIDDLAKSLRAKEKDGKNKGKYELRGKSRTIAELELKDARAEYKDSKTANDVDGKFKGGIAGELKRRERAKAKAEKAQERNEKKAEAAAEKKAALAELKRSYSTSISRGDISQSVTGGLDSARGVVDEMLDLSRDPNLPKDARARFASVGRSAENTLTSLYSRLDKVQADLNEKQGRLDAAKAIQDSAMAAGRSDFVSSITAKSATPASILKKLNDDTAAWTQFGPNLKTLAGKGMPKTFLRSLVDAGLDGATAASKLLNAPNLSDIINAAAGLDTATAAFGDTAASLFDAEGLGVNALQGIVTGLESEKAALTAAIEGIAAEMVAAFKKELGIASPSKVFKELTTYVGDGAVQGLLASKPRVSAAAADMLQVPALTTTTTGQATAGGTNVQLTVINPVGEPTVLTVEKALQDILTGGMV